MNKIIQPGDAVYEDRLLFFVDILGWSNAINRSVDDPRKLEILALVATAIETFVVDSQLEGRGVTAAFFSDTLIGSWKPADPVWTWWYIHKLQHLLNIILVLYGYYSRGSITYGKLFHNGSIVFGPALLEAYRVEQSIAVFPRVVVCESARQFLDEACENGPPSGPKTWYVLDFDGLHFLDVLWGSNLYHLEDRLREYRERDKDNSRLVEKHDWMLRYIASDTIRRSCETPTP
ncbi:MAG TPA: hypothetical protein VHR66_06895 [Gemmataceae bacterium]|jgi:hypothetical protein|nr:hypothetical protein [Gemmataceae bacterium]